MDFTTTTKIKFLPEQVTCLSDQIDCFTRVVTYVVVQALCSKIQGSLPNWTIVIVIVIIGHCYIQWKITKVMDSEKEETMKNCSLAGWPDHSLRRALSLSVQYTESDNTLCGREVRLV